MTLGHSYRSVIVWKSQECHPQEESSIFSRWEADLGGSLKLLWCEKLQNLREGMGVTWEHYTMLVWQPDIGFLKPQQGHYA